MKRYPMIDLAKLYCALLVVLLHSPSSFEGHFWGYRIAASLSYQAVPFFLIVSGFFFVKNWEKSDDKRTFLLKYVRKLLIYYVLWILILSPETINLYVEKYPNSSWFYRAAVIARRIIFSGNGVYWYLLVLAESAVIVSLFLSRGREKLMYILGTAGLVLGFFYDANITALGFGKLRSIFYTIFAWSNNFIMKGIPYMAIGCYLARNHSKWTLRVKTLAVGYIAVALANIILFGVLYQWVTMPHGYMWLYPIQSVLLFLICICHDGQGIPGLLARESRPLSSAIYCVHCFFLNYAVTPLVTAVANTFLRFTLGAAMSITFYWLIKKSGCKPLHRLITLS